ncbi:MAG: GC-type dockerin domain-anchored protein [Phycisphaerales bacterium]
MRHTTLLAIAGVTMAGATAARAQLAITWSSIDGGGTTTAGTGGPYTVVGTIGQPDAGRGTGAAFVCVGGFWAVAAGGGCYANCDGSTATPVLNVNDFTCFLNKFAAGDASANCDGSTTTPVLNVNDFTCFLNAFAAGCS